MAVDWAYASQVGSIGFGVVFAVLTVLAVAIWLVGLLIRKLAQGKAETTNEKKGG